MATPLPGLLEGVATCSVCGGSCIGFPPDGPVLWQKEEPVVTERVFVGRKVRDEGGHLLYGTHDGIPVDHARELAAAGLISADEATRLGLVEPSPTTAKATPTKSRAKRPGENRGAKP